MMSFELNDQLYETSASYITYAKIFPHILNDFLTRQDAAFMVASSNVTITVNPGQVVTTTGSPAAQTGSTVTSGTGSPIFTYKGVLPSNDSELLKATVKTRKEAGGLAVTGVQSAVEVAAGG